MQLFCVDGSGFAPGCVAVYVCIGSCSTRLSPWPSPLQIHSTGVGQVGLRLSNKGKKRSVVSEIYVVDEAGLMRPDSLALHSDGTVHFRQSKKGK